MVLDKSLDDSINLIVALLHDIQSIRNDVFDQHALKLTTRKLKARCAMEGIGFLTKTLPRLGKALDRALLGKYPLDSVKLGFKPKQGCKYPMFMGELFQLILDQDGMVLQGPCISSIKLVRDVCYCFYKYKLPYTNDQEQKVLDGFIKAEEDIRSFHVRYNTCAEILSYNCNSIYPPCADGTFPDQPYLDPYVEVPAEQIKVIRRARKLLYRVFRGLDLQEIRPKHGPGTVSTGEKMSEKYCFSSVSARLLRLYPFDAYFQASAGHTCDTVGVACYPNTTEVPAKVILVPKDSRGPRLISCEPLANQWIQQGQMRAIVERVERHALTRYNVHFTDQQPNQFGALLGSETGRYATLDLKEASDRVTVGLVRLLFPDTVYPYLAASRSRETQLPDGSRLKLNKFAPMGSATCFPILALTVWALLTASTTDADTREGILVYGDDVIVPAEFAEYAIEQLESFGLKINHDKCCVTGFFRESCGVDAYKGRNITPMRFRKVLPTSRCPESYEAWIAYANTAYDRKYFTLYEKIIDRLYDIYGPIPSVDDFVYQNEAPALRFVPDNWRKLPRRTNKSLQKREIRCLTGTSRPFEELTDGWSMLNRYFAETGRPSDSYTSGPPAPEEGAPALSIKKAFSVSSYTKRNALVLRYSWR